jgi:hypothetical protein
MEGSKRRSGWIPKVERGFERSRLESELLATTYERALPVLQRWPVNPQATDRPGNRNEDMETQVNLAAGA